MKDSALKESIGSKTGLREVKLSGNVAISRKGVGVFMQCFGPRTDLAQDLGKSLGGLPVPSRADALMIPSITEIVHATVSQTVSRWDESEGLCAQW